MIVNSNPITVSDLNDVIDSLNGACFRDQGTSSRGFRDVEHTGGNR